MPKLKYEQIADNLRERIAAGEFNPGDRLPSSRDLCEQWGVSRATAIKAMEVLRADGVVVAHQGSGFTITDTPLARPAGDRRASSTRVVGHPFRRMGAPTMQTPPHHVANALGLEGDSRALQRARLILADGGSPFSYVVAWFPPDIADACPRLHNAGPLTEGTTRYVERITGRAPVRGTDVTTVRLATRAEAECLEVKRPCAVAVVLHTAFDMAGKALVCEEGVTPSALFERIDDYPMGSAP